MSVERGVDGRTKGDSVQSLSSIILIIIKPDVVYSMTEKEHTCSRCILCIPLLHTDNLLVQSGMQKEVFL